MTVATAPTRRPPCAVSVQSFEARTSLFGTERYTASKFHFAGTSLMTRATETALASLPPSAVVDGVKLCPVGSISEKRVAAPLMGNLDNDMDNEPQSKEGHQEYVGLTDPRS